MDIESSHKLCRLDWIYYIFIDLKRFRLWQRYIAYRNADDSISDQIYEKHIFLDAYYDKEHIKLGCSATQMLVGFSCNDIKILSHHDKNPNIFTLFVFGI